MVNRIIEGSEFETKEHVVVIESFQPTSVSSFLLDMYRYFWFALLCKAAVC